MSGSFFMQKTALFVGLSTVDIQYFVGKYPLSNSKVKTQPPGILVGGPATNAAVAFAALGGEPTLISAIGDNAFKTFFKNDFLETGIVHYDLMDNLVYDPVLASVITSEDNGDRTIFTSNPEDVKTLTNPEVVFNSIAPDGVLLDGFYPKIALEVAILARKKGIPVVIDCGSWKTQYTQLLPYIDYAICSEKFLPPGCEDYEDVFKFLQSCGINNSVITRGENSILYNRGKSINELVIKKTEVVDTLGAGDFFHGAFLYSLLNNNDLLLAMQQASKVAAFSVSYKGTRSWLKQSLIDIT